MPKLLPLSLLPALLAAFWLVARARWFWTHNPDLQFGWVVLLLCAYLFWEAWPKKPTPQFQWSRSGIALSVAGLALLFAAQLYQAAFGVTTEGMSVLGVGVMLFIAGNFHYVFGWKGVACFAFSLGFFLIALPLPETIHYPLVAGLQAKVAAANVELLKLSGIPAERVGSTIRLPNCVVGIDEACSGIRSLQSSVMATLFIGHLTLRRNGLRFLLLVLGVGLAMAGNLGRSFFLSCTANARGIEALETWHDTAGWSILAFTAVGVGIAGWLMHKLEQTLERPPAETADHFLDTQNKTADSRTNKASIE